MSGSNKNEHPVGSRLNPVVSEHASPNLSSHFSQRARLDGPASSQEDKDKDTERKR